MKHSFSSRLTQAAIAGIVLALNGLQLVAQDSLPFSYSVETFQHEDDPDVRAFVVKLEQPFLAEEFEKSNYLRLKAKDSNAFLVYPRATRFEQKHAEFYGRLRGEGTAELQLSYETISENPDGSRRVVSRQAKIEVEIPAQAGGSEATYKTWATFQNKHFADLLQYYPNESFFEYLLLQSKERYGVTPPNMAKLMPDKDASEEGLYRLFSSGIELQQSLQRSTLRKGSRQGDLSVHISQVAEPKIAARDYAARLDAKTEDGAQAAPHSVAAIVPGDQYMIHFNSYATADNMISSFEDWAEPMIRLFREDARDHQLLAKYESQLLLPFEDLKPLFDNKSVSSMTLTGSDFFVAEGTDLTVLFNTDDSGTVEKLIRQQVTNAKKTYAELEDRSFNYRGTRIQAVYMADRRISSFVVRHNEWLAVSNSHVGIRRIVDTIQKRIPSLQQSSDYQYATVLLPPSAEEDDGYAYLSDSFLRYLFSPSFKVGERRRKQSLNNLVMLNNASLFHRLEYSRSPENISELVEGRFIGANSIVCPQGGAYAFDSKQDTSTSSVFNRLKYLTPIRELKVLKISTQEQSEYQRYKSRLQSFWQQYFTPVALRFSTDSSMAVDYCLMPFSDSASWASLNGIVQAEASTLRLGSVAKSVIGSTKLLAGRERIASLLTSLPGVDGVLRDDPTLTDLAWLGDRVSLQFCDAHTVLEVDPTRIRNLRLPIPLGLPQQTAIATALFSAAAPIYVGIDVEDSEKADRFLKMLSSRIFLHQQDFGEFGAAIDAYQMPEYKEHQIYVVSYRVYAARIRFYASVIGNQLVAATEPHVLNQAIDAATSAAPPREVTGQLALRINTAAMKKLKGDLRTYWEERTRRASHKNIMPIYSLINLYGASIEDVDQISDAKYGVRYFCPDGEYKYDEEKDSVFSTAYGNREQAWQKVSNPETSSFEQTFNKLKEILLTVKLDDESVSGRLEVRSE